MDADKACTCHEAVMDAALQFLQGRRLSELVKALKDGGYRIDTPLCIGPVVLVRATGVNHLCQSHRVRLSLRMVLGSIQYESRCLGEGKTKISKKRWWRWKKAS